MNLSLNLTVFFKYECVIMTAYHEDLPDMEFNK